MKKDYQVPMISYEKLCIDDVMSLSVLSSGWGEEHDFFGGNGGSYNNGYSYGGSGSGDEVNIR